MICNVSIWRRLAASALVTLIATACGGGKSSSGGSFSDVVGTYTGNTIVTLKNDAGGAHADSIPLVISVTIQPGGTLLFTSGDVQFATAQASDTLDIVSVAASSSVVFGESSCRGNVTLLINKSGAPTSLKGYWLKGNTRCRGRDVSSIDEFILHQTAITQKSG